MLICSGCRRKIWDRYKTVKALKVEDFDGPAVEYYHASCFPAGYEPDATYTCREVLNLTQVKSRTMNRMLNRWARYLKEKENDI